MLKPNPYVYPYIPFEDLSNKVIIDNFVADKKIKINSLSRSISKENIKINFKQENIANKIMEIFLDSRILYGSKKLVKQNYQTWINKLNYFIKAGNRIELSILGFPFKIPVPLKTVRTLPDLGEILSLNRLNNIVELINEVYPPGAHLTVFTEGVFGKFIGINDDEGDAYRLFLEKLNAELFGNNITIKDLRVLEQYIPQFDEQFNIIKAELLKLYHRQDGDFMDKYNQTYPSIYRIVNTRKYELEDLLNVYNDNLPMKKLSKIQQDIREYINKKTHEAIFNYHAYLGTRSRFDALEKYQSGIITLSVSPKSNRLGVHPIDSSINKLPYHGVPVWNEKQKKYTIEYLIDIKRKNDAYNRIFLNGDKDNAPFYYIKK